MQQYVSSTKLRSPSQYVSSAANNFRTPLGQSIFTSKYALAPEETWLQRCQAVVDDVCGTAGGTAHPLMSKEDRRDLVHFMHQFIFLPGGRYIYYGGRQAKYFNNCYIFKSPEDTREEWGRLLHSASDALMSGGGIGNDYTVFRPRGELLRRTGGTASGPIPLAMSVNEHGRNVKQGGSRRSAIYGSLNHLHGDIHEWLKVKDWANLKIPGTNTTYAQAKAANFDAQAPLDFTNISVNYDNAWLAQLVNGIELDGFFEDLEDLETVVGDEELWAAIAQNSPLSSVFLENVRMAMRNGEPGFSFNFFAKEQETGRNACTEVTSADNNDVCNLGSINMAACANDGVFKRAVELGAKFLVCGTIRAEMPNEAIRMVREKNRRLGLGLMGVHEWLLQRNYPYEFNDELRSWMTIYKEESERAANEHCDRFYLNRPVAYRAMAPTGTIAMLAGTTTSSEPIYAVAYKRRYIDGSRETGVETRKFQYFIDQSAQDLINMYGVDPDEVECAISLSATPERRIKFQADMQDYIDMAISSTLNLPQWGSDNNNEDLVESFARIIAKYAPRLRGLTMYPDGSRGGQPLVPVPYAEAAESLGIVFEENSDNACKSGVCGI
jgi:ribonucleoside-diphosphate reductase alpha chain